jgi:hypothetical protein
MAKSYVPERTLEVQYNPRAECNIVGCDWEVGASRSARQRAKDHVRFTGHEVIITVERIATWGPKDG